MFDYVDRASSSTKGAKTRRTRQTIRAAATKSRTEAITLGANSEAVGNKICKYNNDFCNYFGTQQNMHSFSLTRIFPIGFCLVRFLTRYIIEG